MTTTTRYYSDRSPYEGRRYVQSYEPDTTTTTTSTTYYDDGTTYADASLPRKHRTARVVNTDPYGREYVDRSGRYYDERDRGTHDKTNATFLDKLRDATGIEGQPRRGRKPQYELPRDRIADKYGDPLTSPHYEEVGEPRYDPNPHGELREDRTRGRRYGAITHDGRTYRDTNTRFGEVVYDDPNYPYGHKRRRKRENIAKIDHERGYDNHSQGGRHGMDRSLGGLFGGSYYDSLRDNEGYLPDDPNRPTNDRYGDRAIVGDRAFHDTMGAQGDAGAQHVGRRGPRVVSYDKGYGGRSGYGTRYDSHDHYREYKESSRKRNPLSDVGETDKYWIVRCEIPGVRESDVTVSVEGKNLVVRGVRVKEAWNHDRYDRPAGSTSTTTTTTSTGTGTTTVVDPVEGGTATTTKIDWADRETGSRKGKFKRKIRLPARVDQSSVQTSVNHGILEIVVKKPVEYLFKDNNTVTTTGITTK